MAPPASAHATGALSRDAVSSLGYPGFPVADVPVRGEATADEPDDQVGAELDAAGLPDDLMRNVYGLMGLPIDAVDMDTVLMRIRAAAARGTPFLLSTPNLDFLATTRLDAEFRESLLLSDLCPPDGMPIVWISRLLGIPIKERIAGSDIFATLRSVRPRRQLSVFLFGGAEGVVAKASQRINNEAGGVICVGSLYPGFRPVEELSSGDIIEAVNASKAEFLAVGLSARKGQPWLLRNHHRLSIPVRASLGATLAFAAGTVERAPAFLRASGLEWLWRIKEEPHLWTRYGRNLRVLLFLLPARVLPLALALRWNRWTGRDRDLLVHRHHDGRSIVLSLSGAAVGTHVGKVTSWFRSALATKQPVTIDLADIHALDARFLGLLLMLRKRLLGQGLSFKLTGARGTIRLLLRLNGFGFLLVPRHQGG
jgi:N-acetylglucosaminyldiphosphoundecaprenol N-acetyl-beta-D-mannosaminyltransferase